MSPERWDSHHETDTYSLYDTDEREKQTPIKQFVCLIKSGVCVSPALLFNLSWKLLFLFNTQALF